MIRRFLYSLQQFMYGRYGMDKLNLILLGLDVGLTLIGSTIRQIARFNLLPVWLLIGLFLQLLSYAAFGWMVFRALSRNIPARQRENRMLDQYLCRLTDRKNRYYRCPQCRQTVRVPRGKGKICIKCPKCGEKFIRKS